MLKISKSEPLAPTPEGQQNRIANSLVKSSH